MSNRHTEFAIGGFLILLFLSLIGWEIALYYNISIYTIIPLYIATFGFFGLGMVLMTDDQ
ncbi:MAG: hypothetical protein RTV72_11595 [Candidatus Thorarchaeota archaeon]